MVQVIRDGFSTAIEKVESIEKLVESKEKLVASKDETIAKLVASKDETIANIEKLVASKDVIIAKTSKEVLQAKGLMNVRSIYELFLRHCFDELMKLGFFKSGTKFNASDFVFKIWNSSTPTYTYTAASGSTIPAAAHKTIAFLEKARNCKLDLPSLYKTLSNEIHGSPWCGDSVTVYKSAMTTEEGCIVDYVVGEMSLPFSVVL